MTNTTQNLSNPRLPLLRLDVQKRQSWTAPAQIMTAGDKGYLQPFTFTDSWKTYNTDVSSLGLRATKPDGQIADYADIFAVDSQTDDETIYTAKLPEQLFQAPGTVTCYIYDTDGKNILASSNNFQYEVFAQFYDPEKSISYVKDLEAVKAKLNLAADNAAKYVKDIQDASTDASQVYIDYTQDINKALDDAKGKITDAVNTGTGKLDNLEKQYLDKYNDLLKKLPTLSTDQQNAVNKALNKITTDGQNAIKAVQDDWTNQKKTLSDAMASFKTNTLNKVNDLTTALDSINKDTLPALNKKLEDTTKAVQDAKADFAKIDLTKYALKDNVYTKDEVDQKLKDFKPQDLTGYAKTSDLNGYETKADLTNTLKDYAKADAIPDTSSFATKQDLNTKADKTSLDGVYKDLEKAASIDDVNKVLGDYATKEDLTTKADKAELNDYAKKADLPSMPDLSQYATKQDLTGKADKGDLNGLVKGATVNGGDEIKPDKNGILPITVETTAPVDTSNLATKDELNAKADKIELNDYATKEELSEKANEADLNNYATKEDLDTKADKTELSDYAKKADIPSVPDTSQFATKTDLSTKADTTALDAYETKDDAKQALDTKTDKTEFNDSINHMIAVIGVNGQMIMPSNGLATLPPYPDTSNLATKDELNTKADKSSLNDYAKKTDIPAPVDTSKFATKTDVIIPDSKLADLARANQILHTNTIKAGELDNYRDKFTDYKGNNPYTSLGIGPGTKIKASANGYSNTYAVLGINSLNQKPTPKNDNYQSDNSWLVLANCMPLAFNGAPNGDGADMYDPNDIDTALGKFDTQLKSEFTNSDYYLDQNLKLETTNSDTATVSNSIATLLNQFMIWGQELLPVKNSNPEFFETVEFQQQPLFKLYPQIFQNWYSDSNYRWKNIGSSGGYGFYLAEESADGKKRACAIPSSRGYLAPGILDYSDSSQIVPNRGLVVYFAVMLTHNNWVMPGPITLGDGDDTVQG